MAIANVTLNNSFDQWRGVTNQLVVAVNEFESNANLMRFTSNTSSLAISPNVSRGAMVYITPNLSDDISNNGLTIIPSMSVLNATMNLVVASITVANAAYNNANVGLVSANNYSGFMANSVNAYANTVGVSGNAYANFVGVAGNSYALSIDTASNTAAYGNILVSTVASNNYTDAVLAAANAAIQSNIRVSTVASNTYSDVTLAAANAAIQANIRVSTVASNTYGDVILAAANAAIQGNIRVSTVASNTYTDTANTAAYANIRVSTTAANTYALTIDTQSNTAAYANIRVSTVAANAYTDVANTAAYANIRVSTVASNTYSDVILATANAAIQANIRVSTLASNTYTDTANAAAYANIRVSTVASNTYSDVILSTANAAIQGNVRVSTVAANAYTDVANTAAYGNIRVSTVASNTYTDVANTAIQGNIRVSTTAANTYALTIDTQSNTAAYGNIRVSTVAANAYTDVANTAAYANIRVSTVASNTYTDVTLAAANAAIQGNIRVSTVASNTYTDTANTAAYANIRVSTVAANAYTDVANTAAYANIRVSTTAANTYALTIDTQSNTAAYGNILASTIAANNYAGVMANAANQRADTAQVKADDAYNLAVTLSGDTGDIAAVNQIAFNTANAAYNNANVGLVSANNYAGAMANSANAYSLTIVTAANTAAYGNIRVSTVAANAYTDAANAAAYANIRTSTTAANAYTDVANTAAYANIRASTTAANAYALSIDTASNTAAYANIQATGVAANAYALSIDTASNTAAYANIRTSTTAANTYALGIDTASNTAAYANIQVTGAAANAYALSIDTASNTAAYGNIRVSTVAANAYTDAANAAAYANIRASTTAANAYTDASNTAAYANIRASTLASNAYTDASNTAAYANIRVSTVAANSYTDVANTAAYGNIRVSTVAANAYTDVANTAAYANIRASTTAANNYALSIDSLSNTAAYGNILVSTTSANNYAGAMANSGNAYANVVGVSGNNWALATFVRLSSATLQTISSDIAVSGNLTVTGNTTYVNTQTMLIGDNIITLNNDIPVTVAPSEDAGIEVKRGNASNVSLIWNETIDRWRFTNDGTNFNNLITQTELDAKVASVTGTAGRISSTGGTTPVVDLIATGVTASIYGGANQIPVITVDTFGRLTSVANVTVQGMNYPYVNVSTAAANNYAGAMANSANAYALSVDTQSNTASHGNIRISTTAANAYALSIDSLSNTAAYGNILASTVAANNYAGFMANASNSRADTKVASVTGTAGRISSTGGTTPVVDLITTGVTASTYGGANQIPVIVVDTFGRLTSVANVTVQGMDYPYVNVSTAAANNYAGFMANASNSRADTKVASVTGTSGRITSSGGLNPSIDLSTAGAGAASYSAGISAITVDAYGRVTSVTGTANYLTSVTGTSGRITSSGGTTPSIDLATAGAGAASYSSGISAITVDAYGRVTSVTGSAGYAVASSSHFIGTTSIALNRASAAQSLTGITSIDGFASSVQATVTGTNATNLLLGNMADNDSFRLRIGADGADAGWAEIATADNGNEPIFVRQYTGAFATVARTATLLDGSGNTTFPGATVASRFFTGYDSGIANSMSCSGWFRSNGTSGWYNDTYGGGINMEDTTWVRVYANKAFLSTNLIQSNTDVRAPIFYDSNDTGYYINPNGTSNVVRINLNYIYSYNGVNTAGEFAGGWGAYGSVVQLRTDSNGTGTQDGPRLWYHKGGAKFWSAGIEPGTSNGYGIWEDGSDGAWGSLRLTVAVGGNVGIGTNAPSQRLHVVGSAFASTDIRAPIFYDSDDTTSRWNGNDFVMRGVSPTIWFRDTDHNSAMLHCNSNLLYILRGGNDTESWAQVNGQWPFYVDLTNNNATFGGAITAAGNITAFSDISLKTNVQTISNASDLLRKLRGVTFDWIQSGEHSYGCIAQEVEQVIPELVHVNEPTELDDKDKPSIKSLDYSKLVSVLIEGWKDHEKQIEELKQEIDRLKN